MTTIYEPFNHKLTQVAGATFERYRGQRRAMLSREKTETTILGEIDTINRTYSKQNGSSPTE